MRKITILLCGLTFILFANLSFAQVSPTGLNTVLDNLGSIAEKYQRERVHLHLDKPFYAAGDDIWIKSYVVVGAENKLSAWSKVLYIDLLDEKDLLVEQLNVPLVSGMGIADFQLPDTLQAGLYKLRAYTNWMRNFDYFTFFEQSLPIYPLHEDNYSIFHEVNIEEKRNQSNFVSNFQLFSAINDQPIIDDLINYRILMKDQKAKSGKVSSDDEGKFQLSLGAIDQSYQGQIELTFSNGVQKFVPINQIQAENIVQFFPEGGHLIAGLENKIAFKSLGTNGLGKKVEGQLQDDRGNKILDFESNLYGTGSFVFIPEMEKAYFASLKFSDGTFSKTKLPEQLNSGITLSVNNLEESNILFDVLASPDMADQQEVSLILQKEGEVFYAAKRKLSSTHNRFTVPKSLLPLGIVQATILSADLFPLSERVIFSGNKSHILPIKIASEKAEYMGREKVELTIDAAHSADSVSFAALSAAVIDLRKLELEKDDENWNIFTSLLISPYLKGAIENPSQYFDENNDFRYQELDLLMMTQGWSKIDWANLNIDNFEEFLFQPEQSLTISGKVTTLNGRTPIPDAEVIMISTDSSQVLLTTRSNAEGKYVFDNLLFEDGITFVVQAHSEKRKNNVMVHLDPHPGIPIGTDRPYYQAAELIKLSPNSYSNHAVEEFRTFESLGLKSATTLIDEVVVDITLARIKEVTKHSTNYNGAGNADYILTMYELDNCINLATCLLGRFPGLLINNEGWPGLQNTQFTTGSSVTSTLGGMNRMLLIVDGLEYGPEATVSPLTVISPTDVASIELLNRPGTTAIYGSKGIFGVMIITTKTGDLMIDAKKEEVYDVKKTIARGFYRAREFYVPIYESTISRYNPIKDLRSTIHWDPNIVTDETGKSTIEFYTADGPGSYLITIEGIDLQGRIGRKTHLISVKE